MKLIGISGSLSRPSKTELAVSEALRFAAAERDDTDTTLISLSDWKLDFCDGRDPADYRADTRTVIDTITGADALIVGSPIYRGSYSGALKNLLDLIPNDSLRGKAVGILATGGSPHHFLAIEHQFRPLINYFNAYTVPAGVYLHNTHYRNGKLIDPQILQRLKKLGQETVRLAHSLQSNYEGPERPSIQRQSLKAS